MELPDKTKSSRATVPVLTFINSIPIPVSYMLYSYFDDIHKSFSAKQNVIKKYFIFQGQLDEKIV